MILDFVILEALFLRVWNLKSYIVNHNVGLIFIPGRTLMRALVT